MGKKGGSPKTRYSQGGEHTNFGSPQNFKKSLGSGKDHEKKLNGADLQNGPSVCNKERMTKELNR